MKSTRILLLALVLVPLWAHADAISDLPGASRVAAGPERVRLGVATFAAVPTQAQVASLRALGLDAQGMKQLPLAIVRGTRAQLLSAVTSGVAQDVYPDDKMQYFWDVSNRTMAADTAQALGYTGKGVQVAVVDSGIDGTHPDLADHVVHNVKLIGPEYINQHPDAPPGTLVLPIDQGPYRNTDLGSGHGTHVAGIIAADGHTSPHQVGVAPDADLIGYAIGEVLFTTAVISAYDHILDHPEWGVDVVNNSWGSQFMLYDPTHPINVATKATAARRIVVVFAAGNSGTGNTEMSLNPFSAPPWVISVAAGTVSGERSVFSSNGLEMDNSMPVAAKNGHARFTGDRIGQYHPDVTAPGTNIVSSGTPTGVAVSPDPPGSYTAVASGTSMATPHVAGVAALLLQARPRLSPDELRETLEASASLMKDGKQFWQSGYGYVNVPAALTLARKRGGRLDRAHSQADARVLGDRDWKVSVSDLWTWTAPTATVAGVPDTRTFTISVPSGTEGVKATIAYPSGGAVSENTADYTITLLDATNNVIGTSTASATTGVSWVLADLRSRTVSYGAWTVKVEGTVAVSDPDSIDNESVLGRTVTLQAALLKKQTRIIPPLPVFIADGTTSYKFQPQDATVLLSPEGCNVEQGTPTGGLGAAAGTACHSGAMGYLLNRLAEVPGVFTSAPLAAATTVGGPASMTVYLVDAPQPVTGVVFVGRIFYSLDEIDVDGNVWAVAAGDAVGVVGNGRNVVTFNVPPNEVAAGSRLRLSIGYSTSPAGAPTSAARMVYGGALYGDSAMTLTFGHMQ